jgi:hypothetical protein
MITLLREEAELQSSAGAFSVAERGGIAVEKPTEKPRSDLEINNSGRFGSKTNAKEVPIERVTTR